MPNVAAKEEGESSSDDGPPSEEVETLVGQRRSKADGGANEYKIRWKGYGPDEDTWQPQEALCCDDLLHDFWEQRRVDLDPGFQGGPEDDERNDGEPKVAANFVEVWRAEKFSIMQVVELALTTEQVQKMERR